MYRFPLPEFVVQLAAQQPFSELLTPDDVRKHLRFDRSIVVSTACNSGDERMAEAFLARGARYYIAPQGYPDGSSALLYVLNFYYHLFHNQLDVEAAHAKAKSQDSETQLFELYQ